MDALVVAERAARSRGRGAALALTGFVGLLALLVGPVGAAEAYSPGTLLSIGSSMAGVGEEVASDAVSAGTASVAGGDGAAALGVCAAASAGACLAAGAAIAAAGVLIDTSSHWVPWLAGALGGAFSGGGTTGNVVQLTGCSLSGPDLVCTLTSLLTSQQYFRTGFSLNSSEIGVQPEYGCLVNGVTTVYQPSNSQDITVSAGQSYALTYPLCATGTAVFVQGFTSWQPGYGYGSRATVTMGDAVPASTVSVVDQMVCNLPGGGTQTLTDTVTGQSDYVEVPSCAQQIPGSWPASNTVKAGYPGAEQTQRSTSFTNWKTAYPGCFDASGNFEPSVCVAEVYVGGVECTPDVAGCSNWSVRSNASCLLGGTYSLPLSDCAPLKYQYQEDSGSLTLDSPASGSASAATGTASPGAGTPSSGTNPVGPGQSYDPGSDGQAGAQSQSCWGSGWSWNPVSWVFVPVKCALSWAFVPTVAPAAVAAPSLSAWSALVPSALPASSCGSETVTLELPGAGGGPTAPGDVSGSLPDTCDGTWSTLASTSYAASAIGCSIFALVFVVRQVGKET